MVAPAYPSCTAAWIMPVISRSRWVSLRPIILLHVCLCDRISRRGASPTKRLLTDILGSAYNHRQCLFTDEESDQGGVPGWRRRVIVMAGRMSALEPGSPPGCERGAPSWR